MKGADIIKGSVCFAVKFAYFSSNQIEFSSVQDSLTRHPKFLTDNQHGSSKSRVLVCNINTPLPTIILH